MKSPGERWFAQESDRLIAQIEAELTATEGRSEYVSINPDGIALVLKRSDAKQLIKLLQLVSSRVLGC